jgi:hypothetical protein
MAIPASGVPDPWPLSHFATRQTAVAERLLEQFGSRWLVCYAFRCYGLRHGEGPEGRAKPIAGGEASERAPPPRQPQPIRAMNFIKTDHGPALKAAAQRLAPFIALVITCLWLAADAAYDLGRQLRLAIEARSEQLAAWHLALLGLEPTARPARVAAVAATSAPEPPAPALAIAPVLAAAPATTPAPGPIRKARRPSGHPRQRLAAA